MIPSLHSAMPQDLYARLVGREPFYQVRQIPASAKALKDAVITKQTDDASLANLDDSMKRVGSALIATLATLGASRKIIGVGEFMGFATWFLAMGLTPKILNGLIWVKTGVNLNQEYINTQGHRRPLFYDPKFLPLHLISDEEMNEIANRLGIPNNMPDRRRLTEEKIRQISVQGRTWWMLMAGPATPVLSGMFCDLFQQPVTNMINRLRRFYHLSVTLPRAMQAGTPKETVIKRLNQYTEQMVGEVPHSWLSQWWDGFGTEMVKALGLKKHLHVHEVITPSSVESVMDKLSDVLLTLQAKEPGRLEKTTEYLKAQKAELAQMKEETLQHLQKYQHHLEAEQWQQIQTQISERIKTAEATLEHYQRLVEGLKTLPQQKRTGDGLRAEVRSLLKDARLAQIQKFIEFGSIERAKKVAGSDAAYHEVRDLLAKRRFTAAFNRLGASPGDHLLLSLTNSMLRKLWRTRMLLLLGGGMLVASVIYSHWFVGKDFKQEPTEP